ncbi:MAG: hypothetical protein LAO79_23445 [Acidobacteriia bacterium]|nr:hypothetical protein [Terriglobia bacterium]
MASEPRSNIPTAAGLLVAELEAHSVDRVFCVPGESYLSVLDADGSITSNTATIAIQ